MEQVICVSHSARNFLHLSSNYDVSFTDEQIRAQRSLSPLPKMVQPYVSTEVCRCYLFLSEASLDENSFPYPLLSSLPASLHFLLPSLTHHLLPSRICGSCKLMKGALGV